MKQFDPIRGIEKSNIILDNGQWPNFHDAEIHELKMWRGDIRPDDNVWTGPIIETTIELCALQNPYIVVLRFHYCCAVNIKNFGEQNYIYDLKLSTEERGFLKNGQAVTSYIRVTFEQNPHSSFDAGIGLSFKCFRIEALKRKDIV